MTHVGPRAKEQQKNASVLGNAKRSELMRDPAFAVKISQQISEGVISRWSRYGHNWVGRKHSEETKAKIGSANVIK